MKKFLFLLIFIPQLVFAQKNAQPKQKEFISAEIQPMVDFIKKTNTSPADYIMGLFEKYDVVVLGERDHMDTTQYDLINQIISDKRFIDKVGNVFTEIGSYNVTDRLNKVLKASYAHDSIFDVELVKVIFDICYMPLWDKTNYTQLFRDIYQINKTLPEDKKLTVTPTDVPFSWNQTKIMTGKEFKPFFKIWEKKDMIMGNIAVAELCKIFDGDGTRKKVLYILNTPHSCRDYKSPGNPNPFAYQIIADRFPGRVANVAINWATSGDESYTSLSNGGKIDASFAACGNKSIGFDLAGTPFANCNFDYMDAPAKDSIKFNKVYHGLIFYKPVKEWVDCIGVPNLTKINVRDELARRHNVWDDENNQSEEYKDHWMEYYGTVKCFPVTMFFDEKIIDRQISTYYRPATK